MAGDIETNPGPHDLAGQISMILDIVSNINSKQNEVVSRITRIEEDIKAHTLEDKSIPRSSCSLTSSSTSNDDPRSEESQLGKLIQEKSQYAFELNYYMEENSVLKSKLDSEKKEKGALEKHLVEVLKQKQTLKHLITELQNQNPKYELGECELKSTEVHQSSELKCSVDSGVATFDKETLPDSDAQNTQKTVLLVGGNKSMESNTIEEKGDEFDYSGDLSLKEGTTAHDCTKLASVERKYKQIAPYMIKHFQTCQESQPTNASASTKNSSLKDQNSACSLKDEINKKQVQPNSCGYQLFMHWQAQQDQSTYTNIPTDFSPERQREETGDERKKTQTHNSDLTSPCNKSSQSLVEGEDQLMNNPKNSIASQNFMKMKERTKTTQNTINRPERTLDQINDIAVLANEKWMANKNQLTSEETYGLCSLSSDEPNQVVGGDRLAGNEELPLASVFGKLPYPIKETVSRQIQSCDLGNQGRHGNKSQPYKIKQPPDKPKIQIKKGKECLHKILQSIAKKIGSDWLDLLRTLDIEEARIEIIGDRYKTVDERAFQGLLHWTRKLGSDATLDGLKAALERVDRRDLRERLETDELA
ncbi:uncharacterized protein [Ptychodera flava]|uniref:uncharacterized protein n=1 Tax=Ptychodera flava TaxID=63121 RepID=UPI003969F251